VVVVRRRHARFERRRRPRPLPVRHGVATQDGRGDPGYHARRHHRAAHSPAPGRLPCWSASSRSAGRRRGHPPAVRRDAAWLRHRGGRGRHADQARAAREDRTCVRVGAGALTSLGMLRPEKPKSAGHHDQRSSLRETGGVLLSQGFSPQVPSALTGLTSVFGMGTGVTLSLWPPEISCQRVLSHSRTPEQARAVNPSPRPISTGRLNTLLCVHLRPINVMVSSRALLR
jgi:hypothetical protein